MMVHPDSHRIPRVPRYSGNPTGEITFWLTGLSPSMVGHSMPNSAKVIFCNSLKVPGHLQSAPTTPQRQRTCPLASLRFRLFPFRSPLLRKSRLISFPLGTMMVHFPRFAPQRGITILIVIGCPILLSPDQS